MVRNRPSVPITFSMLVDGLIIQKGKKEKVKVKEVELASVLGVSTRTIRRYRYGGSNPDRKHVIEIGVFFGLDLEEIKFLLYLAGYADIPNDPIECYYEYVIVRIKGSGVERIMRCNQELFDKKVPEEKMFGYGGDVKER